MHSIDESFWGMHLIWWVLWIFFLIWIFLIPFGNPRKKKHESPLEILKKRFAKGEISKEEFEESKMILKSKKD